MRTINILLLYVLAPVIGFFVAFYFINPYETIQTSKASLDPSKATAKINDISHEIDVAIQVTNQTQEQINELLFIANEQKETLTTQAAMLDSLVFNSLEQTRKSDIVLEKILSNLLGEPIHNHNGDKSSMKVYSLNEAGYRGYMAKVKVHHPDALKLVLANDKVRGSGETTSHAAKRKNAILAVNAGGFWRTEDGSLAVLGSTIVDGQIKTYSNHPDLSFVGFNRQGHLVGGKVTSRKQLEEFNALQGASFVPTLLQDGKKITIPKKWANAKHPRTIVGNFSNGELLFIVIDGRRKGWSSGVTLEELQDKLLSFKIKDAFNLDGGGSSAFYYNGEILNRPSDGKQRKVTTNIVILP